MTGTELLYERSGSIATLTLNRPQAYNAMSNQMREELRAALKEIRGDAQIRLVVLTGAGKAFSSGGDVKLMRRWIDDKISYEQRLATYRQDVSDMVRLMKSVPQPIIAKINGATYGAGCSIAALCDIRIAADHAKFGLPFGRRGLIPDWGASYTLPRLIGASRALELAITGRSFDAAQALQMGFVNHVVPKEELDDFVAHYCQEILLSSPKSMKSSKALLTRSMELEFDSMLEWEAQEQSACFSSDDHREGVDCFLEKRAPNFTGT